MPLPVAISTTQSEPASSAEITSHCIGRNAACPKCAFSVTSASAAVSSARAGAAAGEPLTEEAIGSSEEHRARASTAGAVLVTTDRAFDTTQRQTAGSVSLKKSNAGGAL